MKKLTWILFAVLIASATFGQSTTTSKTADSLLIRTFLSNTAPLRDSLIRFEYTKQRLTVLQFDYRILKEFNTSLSIQNNDLATRNSQLSNTVAMLGDSNTKLKKRLRNSRIEKWAWRLGAATYLYFKIRPFF